MVAILAKWRAWCALQVLACGLLWQLSAPGNVACWETEPGASGTAPTTDASEDWFGTDVENSSSTMSTVGETGETEPDDYVTTRSEPGDADPAKAAERRAELVHGRFREHIGELKRASERLDLVFLIDASSSVGPTNFHSELRFVKKLLADLDVSVNRTRVAVVTFSSRTKVTRHVDQISEPSPANDKCLLLNAQMPSIRYTGGGTYTYGALREAEGILARSGVNAGVSRAIFLITDGYSNGPSPVPVARRLQAAGVTMFAIGIETGNDEELASLVTSPAHRYLLASFEQFETLVRQALHLDYRPGPSLPVDNATFCDGLCEGNGGCCDERAFCACSPTSGHYRCACEPGYGGSGLRGHCQQCPVGTFWVADGQCEACRSTRHITLRAGATSERDCVCPHGYQEDEDGRCVAITCPKLNAPEHGYFVMDPKPCGQVLNAACGARCRPGYELTGSSIRLCQENGEWSGTEVKCTMKTCPPLSIPYYGMAVCRNPDIDLLYDYTPRNKSFLLNYSATAERVTVAMPVDTECAFKCGQGFYLKGSHNRSCLPLSKWDGLQTTCTQILCPALPKVAFGSYDPTDCAEAKSAYGTNCTLVCDFGFELKHGPATKQCGGKRTGVWNKTKTPKCVDIVPPYIECPGNYTVLLDDDHPYALLRRLQQPYVFDNSGDNFTYWAKPTLKEGGMRLALGEHEFTYVAVDAFNNRAHCRFAVSVVDQTPPVLEQCVDAPVQYVSDADNRQELLVQWHEPLAFDNAGSDNVTVTVSHAFGYLPVGLHQVVYRAVDASGNAAECTVRVEVRQYSCETPVAAPVHGVSICAQNGSHVWCDLSCTGDYAFHEQTAGDDGLGTMRIACERAHPSWAPSMEVPECTETVLPAGVEKVLTIRLDGAPDPMLCDDAGDLGEVSQAFSDGLREAMCEEQQDNCTLLTTVPLCADPANVDDATHYRIVRRSVAAPETEEQDDVTTVVPAAAAAAAAEEDATPGGGPLVKVVVYKRISQQLGLWRADGKQSENIKRIKEELAKINANKKLRRRLGTLNLDLSVLKLDEKIRCANGSIARKLVCVHCPRGTYHNYTTNGCVSCPAGAYNEQTGQSACRQCPKNYSTRRPGAKHAAECKAQCPPGTVAKLKPAKVSKPAGKPLAAQSRYHKTLMPFCRQCEPGQFQGQYNRAQCQPCPAGHSSGRGSTRLADCFPLPAVERGHPCRNGSAEVCGPHGQCVADPTATGGYDCVCEGAAVGAHCERMRDACGSAPCFNGARCQVSGADVGRFRCECVPPYRGPLCEEYVDPCRKEWCANGGSCVESEGRAVCECPVGFEGDRCELAKDFCSPNPCESDGMCVSVGEGYKCECPRGKTGRRCHLEPCDYMPCPSGARCRHGDDDDQLLVVLPSAGSNRSTPLYSASYRCICPAGLRDPGCTTVDNPCETSRRDHCRNGATCEPLKLRTLPPHAGDAGPGDEDEEELYRSVRCNCPRGYYGDRCERQPSVDFVLHFPPGTGVHAYAKVAPGPAAGPAAYRAMTVCGWYQTDDDFNYGALVSYATAREDNALTLTDYSGLVLYVNGAHVVTNVSLNDGEWHFLCFCWAGAAGGRWELFLDGELRAAGRNLSANVPIPAGGLFVLGQEQDGLGGGFSETESFRGRMAYVDVWSRALPASDVRRLYRSCEPDYGDVLRWTDARLQTVGPLRVEPSEFCAMCPRNHSLPNGSVRYEGIAHKVHFRCDEGYELIGTPYADCLRTSRWSPGVRFCKLVRCGMVAAPTNGQVALSKPSYGGEARFSCDEGFVLAGPDIIYCTATGFWSGSVPECISLLKCAPLAPEETGGQALIIYATERGPIGRTLPAYDVGVLAEIRCAPGYTLEGDNLLTCDEGGQWDLPLPLCSSPVATTQMSPSSLVIRVNRRPDVHFWKSLKDYLLHGCATNRHVSPFCNFPEAGGDWSDLSGFSVQRDSAQGSSIDVKLLAFLTRSVRANNVSSVDRLRPNGLLQYILYGSVDPIAAGARFPPAMEDVYRFVICQFIDVILMDRELNYDGELEVDIALEENTNAKIKYLLKYVVQPIHRQYQRWEEERSAREAAALRKIIGLAPDIPTPAPPKRCPLNRLPSLPMDGRVVAVNLHRVQVAPEREVLERLHYSDLQADVGDRVRYGCEEGFSVRGSSVSECGADGRWTLPDWFCEGAICENPPVRPNMHIAPQSLDTQYYVDDEIELWCAAGYAIKGQPIIKCQPDGRWTPIMARCTRISCGRPKIPNVAKILSGNSFFFGDALTVRCPQRTLDIVCQSTGQWTPLDEC